MAHESRPGGLRPPGRARAWWWKWTAGTTGLVLFASALGLVTRDQKAGGGEAIASATDAGAAGSSPVLPASRERDGEGDRNEAYVDGEHDGDGHEDGYDDDGDDYAAAFRGREGWITPAFRSAVQPPDARTRRS